MECKNHDGVDAVDRCAGCAEPFCANCLVTIDAKPYCADCKVMAVPSEPPPWPEDQTEECKEAGEALKFAIIGIFCFGIILGPIAIAKGLKAKRMIEADPHLTGFGKANAALWVGLFVLLFWSLTFVGRMSGN